MSSKHHTPPPSQEEIEACLREAVPHGQLKILARWTGDDYTCLSKKLSPTNPEYKLRLMEAIREEVWPAYMTSEEAGEGFRRVFNRFCDECRAPYLTNEKKVDHQRLIFKRLLAFMGELDDLPMSGRLEAVSTLQRQLDDYKRDLMDLGAEDSPETGDHELASETAS